MAEEENYKLFKNENNFAGVTLVSKGGKKDQTHSNQNITNRDIAKDFFKPEKTTCPHFEKIFSTKKRMKCHMSLVYKLRDNEAFKIEVAAGIEHRNNTLPEITICPYCTDVFSTNKRMKCHMSIVHELQPLKRETKTLTTRRKEYSNTL